MGSGAGRGRAPVARPGGSDNRDDVNKNTSSFLVCPACGLADLIPFGAKYRCPACYHVSPCCETDCEAR